MPVDLAERHISFLRETCAAALGGRRCTVYLFGSRATGRAVAGSDVDLAVECATPVDRELCALREALEESHLPYFADVVDLKTAGEALRRQVLAEGAVLWKS